MASISSTPRPSILAYGMLDDSQFSEPLFGFSSYSSESSVPTDTDIEATALSPKEKERQAYEKARKAYLDFCMSAKDLYFAYANHKPIKATIKIDITTYSELINARYKDVITKNAKDLSLHEQTIIKKKDAYDKAARAFAEFQKSASDTIKDAVIASIRMRVSAACETVEPLDNSRLPTDQSPTTPPSTTPPSTTPSTTTQPSTTQSLIILFTAATTLLAAKKMELEQQAAQLFMDSACNRLEAGLKEKIVKTYNDFYKQRLEVEKLKLEVEKLKTPKKRPSKTMRFLKATADVIGEFFRPDDNVHLWS